MEGKQKGLKAGRERGIEAATEREVFLGDFLLLL
jgi:hypothetical protein